MPKIDKIFSLEITPEQFLNACSPAELKEIDLLIQSNRFRKKMVQFPSKDMLDHGAYGSPSGKT